ncbi:unnamed protein product [marine sediment metagenome]|uniref:Uncharacterized protein n=1 Tax=marine sediment metagenome TaxID=412755 RepID=X1GLA7_9ZZZZ
MPRITAKRKKYCLMKIEMLDLLISKSTNPKQKEIYEGFRQKFVDELPKTQNPDIIAEKTLEKERLAELKEQAALEAEKARIEEIKIKAEKETKQAAILKQIEDLKKLIPQEGEKLIESKTPIKLFTEKGRRELREEGILVEIKDVEEEDEPEPEPENPTNP